MNGCNTVVRVILLTAEDPGSRPAISNFYRTFIYIVNCVKKTKLTVKKAGEWPL